MMRLIIGTEDRDEIRAAASWSQRTGIFDVLHQSMYIVLTWWAHGDEGYDVVPGSDLFDWLRATVSECKARPDRDVVSILRKRMARRGVWLVIREKHAPCAEVGAAVRLLRHGVRYRSSL